MKLKYHYDAAPGYSRLVTPQTHPVKWLDFAMVKLEEGGRYQAESEENEIGLVILTGTCSIQVNEQVFENLGGRASVFDGRATGVYVPRQAAFVVEAQAGGVEVALCRCQADQALPVQVVRPEDVVAREVGGVGFKRYVHDIFGLQMQAEHMIVGETFTLASNWSSFPPHKHDQELAGDEVVLEELYLYKVRPLEGFGLQCIYSRSGSPHGELDEAMIVRNDDVTVIPYGYHPVSAPPGYDVYYLWFLNGPRRQMHPNDDPAYAWIKTAPEEQRVYP